MKKLILTLLLLSCQSAFAQYDQATCSALADGPWTITNQEPLECVAFKTNSMYTKRLPDSGTGGPIGFLAPGSDVAAESTFLRDHNVRGTWPPELYGFSKLGTYGDATGFSQVPIYYGQASDPIYILDQCDSCGDGSSEYSPKNKYWHIPSNAAYAGRIIPNNGEDKFLMVWDQTNNKLLQIYGSYGVGFIGACSATTEGTACSIPRVQYGTMGDYTSATKDWGIPSSATTTPSSTRSLGGAMLIRLVELQYGIKHALYLDTDCEREGTVFPSSAGSSEQAQVCGVTDFDVLDGTKRPYHSALLFFDYTDLQIDAMVLPIWQKNIVRAMSHYGGYIGDTGGVNQAGLSVEQFEADEAYQHVTGSRAPFWSWLEAQGVPCSGGTAPASLCTYELNAFAGLPNLTGPNCPSTPCGPEKHIHIAAECIALLLASQPGSCGVPYDESGPTPDSFLVTQQPTNVETGDVITPSITVQIVDSEGTTLTTSGVTITASLVAVTECEGVLGGDPTKATNASGIATFNDLTVSLDGTCRIAFSANTYTSVTSNPFTVVDEPPIQPVNGPIQIDGTPAATVGGSQTQVQSHTLTIANVANRYLVMCASTDSGLVTASTAIIQGASAMTLLARGYSPSGGVSMSMWGYIGPPTGSVTVTFSMPFGSFQTVGAVALYNVHQTTPIRDVRVADARTGEASDSTLTLTSTVNDYLVSCATAGRDADAVNLVPGGGMTQRYEESMTSAPSDVRSAAGSFTSNGSSAASIWDWTGTTNYVHAAVDLIPAVAPAAGTIRMR